MTATKRRKGYQRKNRRGGLRINLSHKNWTNFRMYGYAPNDCIASTLQFLGLLKNKKAQIKLSRLKREFPGLGRRYVVKIMKYQFPEYDFWFDNVPFHRGRIAHALFGEPHLEWIFNDIAPGKAAYGRFRWENPKTGNTGGHAIVLAKNDEGEPFIVDLHRSGKNATILGRDAILGYFIGNKAVEIGILQSSKHGCKYVVGDGKKSSHCSSPITHFDVKDYSDGDTVARYGVGGDVGGDEVLPPPYKGDDFPYLFQGGRHRRRRTRRRKAKRRRTRRKRRRTRRMRRTRRTRLYL